MDELFRTITLLFIHRDKIASTKESKILPYCNPRRSFFAISLLPPFQKLYFQLSTYRSFRHTDTEKKSRGTDRISTSDSFLDNPDITRYTVVELL